MIKSILKRIHAPIYEKRLSVLAGKIVAQLRDGDTVLDVGCGSGMLGAAVLAHPRCPKSITYKGVERTKRGGEPIEVIAYAGGQLPFEDGAFDVVILADVLHHERDEALLLRESARVAKRTLILKDHKPEGLLGYQRLCFLDWAANNPYEVECLYRYHTKDEWRAMFDAHALEPLAEETAIDLYPPLFNWIFGRRLQYFAVLRPGRPPAP
jgi:ubiquinone/menaquinone biosynthesis C-methylase UbiE